MAPSLLPFKAGSPQTTLYFQPYVTVTSTCRVQQGPTSPAALETQREPELRLSHPDALSAQHRVNEKHLCNGCLSSDHQARSFQTPCHQKGGF